MQSLHITRHFLGHRRGRSMLHFVPDAMLMQLVQLVQPPLLLLSRPSWPDTPGSPCPVLPEAAAASPLIIPPCTSKPVLPYSGRKVESRQLTAVSQRNIASSPERQIRPSRTRAPLDLPLARTPHAPVSLQQDSDEHPWKELGRATHLQRSPGAGSLIEDNATRTQTPRSRGRCPIRTTSDVLVESPLLRYVSRNSRRTESMTWRWKGGIITHVSFCEGAVRVHLRDRKFDTMRPTIVAQSGMPGGAYMSRRFSSAGCALRPVCEVVERLLL